MPVRFDTVNASMKVSDTSRFRSRSINAIARTRLLRVLGRCFYLTLVFGSVGSTTWSQQRLPALPDGSPTSFDTTSFPDGTPVAPALDRNGAIPTGSDVLVLSASQIFDLLSIHPDTIVEVKQFLAGELSRSGPPVQDNDISDEMLYSQIAESAAIRAGVTNLLRSRGYINADDFRQAAVSRSDDLHYGDQRLQVAASTTSSSTAEKRHPDLQEGYPPPERSGIVSQERLVNRRADSGSTVPPISPDVGPEVLRIPAPYNLRSMRDLYTQVPEPDTHLKRYGADFFTPNSNAMLRGLQSRDVPLDVPIGPDYILGPGDTLTLNLWGGTTQTFTRTLDREGKVLLPEAGSVTVGGLKLSDAQRALESALQGQYRNAHLSVTVSRLHSVRVYVVGDVQRPGAYDISALATPLSALFAAGGPTSSGSLRVVRHLRGQTLVEEADLYELTLRGVRPSSARFQSGDTVLVPPVGAQISISGAVLRPAIYELRPGEEMLETALKDAGGVTVAAALNHITVERVSATKARETLTVTPNSGANADLKEAIAHFALKDGDRVRVSSILPYSERVLYLEGHVVRPGRLPYSDGMQLSDVLHSYRDLLPEPARKGELVRLVPPDLHAEIISFDVPDVLIGNSQIPLQPFDTIRVFGRYQADAPKVTITGEVLRPGSFPLSDHMTTAQLVRLAGGFKRNAYLESADLTSYSVVDGKRVASELRNVRIGAAVNDTDKDADEVLKPGDILTIHEVTGWNEIGSSVTVEGQIPYPGSYGLREGERLSSILRRAGGFRASAYPEGAILVRDEVRELQEQSRQELIRQIETSSSAARLSPALGSDTPATLQLIKTQQDEIIGQLKSQPATGRLVVHISSDIGSWANTQYDVELRRGDVIRIPKRPGFVLVTGQVYNPTALTFTSGKTARWYLSHAGGASGTANRKEIFVIRANGSIIGRHSGRWLDTDVLSTKLNPGDVVVVPQKILGSSQLWRNLLTTAQLASSIAITAAVAAL